MIMTTNKIQIIDPHLHLFALQQGDYNWLNTANPPFWPDKYKIARSYTEQDLSLPANMKLAGFVHIEAGFDNKQPWREIDYLEHNCMLPFTSIAHADLCSPTFTATINQLNQRKSVVGIRHILDDDANTILNHPLSQPHFALLNKHNWVFDAQLSLHDYDGALALLNIVRRFPNIRFIINHGGWPPTIQALTRKTWEANLKRFSQLPNCAIKLSAWEMVNRQWSFAHANDIATLCLDLFGLDRVMLASNFPLCNFSFTYHALWSAYMSKLGLSEYELSHLTLKNAAHWYKLKIVT